jgi:anti-anti-sigma factor
MEIQTESIDGHLRLIVSGETTLAHAQTLRATLLDCLEQQRPVVLDLEGVTETDVACLQVLAAAERSFTARGQPFRIVAGDSVSQAWSLAGFVLGEANCGQNHNDRG